LEKPDDESEGSCNGRRYLQFSLTASRWYKKQVDEDGGKKEEGRGRTRRNWEKQTPAFTSSIALSGRNEQISNLRMETAEGLGNEHN
jgi:hypothetical protein